MNTFMQKLGVLTISLSVFLSASAADFEVDGICYNITDSEAKTVEVTSADPKYTGDITLPASVTYNEEQYAVTAIGYMAFALCTDMTSITIPKSVTAIGVWAFASCSGMTTITIPNSVTTIGENAFSNCTGLTSINVDNDNQAYSSVEGILYDKLQTNLIHCPMRKTGEVIIPNSVITIGEYAFSDCSGLTAITIPNFVTTIGKNAFAYCRSLNTITIPNFVTTIGEEAFAFCSGLILINIPNSVITIGKFAFSGCSGLTSITIPNSVTTIGDEAFSQCNSLTSIDVDNDNQAYSSGDGILYNKSLTNLICFPAGKTGEVIIPNSVTTIGNGAFASCSGLTSITIPNFVTTIGERAFYLCSGLTSIISFAVAPPECGNYGFYEVDTQNCTLYVPAESQAAYRQAEKWSAFPRTENIVYVSDIQLNVTEVRIEEGTTSSLIAEVQPEEATNKMLLWESSDAGCVTVDESGVLTALANGTATITVRSYDGKAEATCAVTVGPTTGIEAVETAANDTVEVFTLTGVKVARTTANLPAGIYLVRRGSTVSKLLVR